MNLVPGFLLIVMSKSQFKWPPQRVATAWGSSCLENVEDINDTWGILKGNVVKQTRKASYSLGIIGVVFQHLEEFMQKEWPPRVPRFVGLEDLGDSSLFPMSFPLGTIPQNPNVKQWQVINKTRRTAISLRNAGIFDYIWPHTTVLELRKLAGVRTCNAACLSLSCISNT